MSGRDRTGMVAMLLLAAIETEEDAIVDDYLCTVRPGALRAANVDQADREPVLDLPHVLRAEACAQQTAMLSTLGAELPPPESQF